MMVASPLAAQYAIPLSYPFRPYYPYLSHP